MIELFNRVLEISKKYDEIDLISGSRFNLFNVLGITTDEVRLHSKFISELLDPNGSHGQGSIFLKIFLEIIIEQKEIKFDYDSAKVEVEMSIGNKTETTGGRIDIYIEDQNKNSITIENKIYAADQENQLLRYSEYKKDNIFYLNLIGTKPSKNSYGTLRIGKDFRIISYKEHIISWLEKCRKEAVELPLLREGITHYINLLKILVGQSNNKAMEKEIRDLIMLNKENLKNSIEISRCLIAAKIKLQWNFWEKLKAAFEKDEKYIIYDCPENVDEKKVRGYYEKSRNRDNHFGLWFQIYTRGDIAIYFGIEISTHIYYGFTIEDKGIDVDANKEEYSKFKNIVHQIDSDYSTSNSWLGWKFSKPKLNFRDFNSEEIFDLADDTTMDNTVNAIVADSIFNMESFQESMNM